MLVLSLLGGVESAAAAECSMRIFVKTPEGVETPARIVVEELNGRVIETKNQPGGVPICDLGILPVTIRIGHEACNQVILKNVPITFDNQRVVHVIYDRAPCLVEKLPAQKCEILIRILDKTGRFLPSAIVALEDGRRISADDFGRVLLDTKFGNQLSGMVHLDDFAPQGFAVSCSRAQSSIEHRVTMHKASAIQ